MNQAALTYLKGRIVGEPEYINSGDIVTTCTVTFDDGVSMTGSSVRQIASFDTTEAHNAAYADAVASLVPGVEFILTKMS